MLPRASVVELVGGILDEVRSWFAAIAGYKVPG